VFLIALAGISLHGEVIRVTRDSGVVIAGFCSFGALDHQRRVLHQSSLPYFSEDRDSFSYHYTKRWPRKARQATWGIMLDKMNKAMGRRMPISLAKGNRRPHDPVQAAKFASEAGVAVRSQVPIMTHWKEYKAQSEHFDGFVGRVSMSAYLLVPILHPTLTWPLCNSDYNSNHEGRLAIDTRHRPIADACVSVFKSSIRQRRYKLK
jgi:hypothetical protein